MNMDRRAFVGVAAMAAALCAHVERTAAGHARSSAAGVSLLRSACTMSLIKSS